MRLKLAKHALFILLNSLELQAYTPVGYIGCFKDSRHDRVLNGANEDFYPNGGDRCKIFCSRRGYRYAGTESGEECFCGHTIRYKRQANECNYICELNYSEVCGGDWRISIYDTWHCVTEPCRNGATCKDIDAKTYMCACTRGWTGKNCEHEKLSTTVISSSSSSSPSTTKTTTPTTTARTSKITTTQIKTSASTGTQKRKAEVRSTEDDTFASASIDVMPNTTHFPFIKSDDQNNSVIALYVLLPLCAVVALVLIMVICKWRKRRKEEPILEYISKGTGSVPNIYANLTYPQSSQFERRNDPPTLTGTTEFAVTGQETGEIGKENRRDLKQETEGYNTITLRQNNKPVFQNSYARVEKPNKSVNRTYSKLSANYLINDSVAENNTYSHIKNSSGQNHTDEYQGNTDNTYNTLELRTKVKLETSDSEIEDYSEYNHTNMELPEVKEDNYSHINTTRELQTDIYNNSCVGEVNIYFNDVEYATVEKALRE